MEYGWGGRERIEGSWEERGKKGRGDRSVKGGEKGSEGCGRRYREDWIKKWSGEYLWNSKKDLRWIEEGRGRKGRWRDEGRIKWRERNDGYDEWEDDEEYGRKVNGRNGRKGRGKGKIGREWELEGVR